MSDAHQSIAVRFIDKIQCAASWKLNVYVQKESRHKQNSNDINNNSIRLNTVNVSIFNDLFLTRVLPIFFLKKMIKNYNIGKKPTAQNPS